MATNRADTLPGDIQEATASGGRQACGLPCASRNPKRKKERGSNSPTPTSRKKPKPVRNSRDAINPSDNSESEDEIDELEGAEIEMRELKIRDVRDNYYIVAYRSISQLCCKDTVKAWIRVGQPRKQTTHPYNGGKSSRERSLAEYNYPGHYSMPDYWPSDEDWQVGRGCRHREPDHVKKLGQSVCELVPASVLTSQLERLILLVHLLRSEGKGYTDGDFSLDKLKQATANIHLECGKNWKPEYVDRLKEIYWVRGQEMKFELGEMGEFCSLSWQFPFVLTLRQMEKLRCLSGCQNHVPKVAKPRSRPPRLQVHLASRLKEKQRRRVLEHAVRLLLTWASSCKLMKTISA